METICYFLVDSEIWPNLILQAKKKNILLGIINARITSKTFHRWAKIPRTSKKYLVHLIYVLLQILKLGISWRN